MDTSFRTIYIENFPLNASEKLLLRLLSNFGSIRHINMPTFELEHPLCRGLPRPKAKGYAFVEFDKKEAADRACQFFNDLKYIKAAAQIYNGGSSQTVDIPTHGDPSLTRNLIQNLEFKRLLLIRVMPKREFLDLSRAYNERKLNATISAARLLMVT